MRSSFAVLALMAVLTTATDAERRVKPRFKPKRFDEEEETQTSDFELGLTNEGDNSWARRENRRGGRGFNQEPTEEETADAEAKEEEESKIPPGWYSETEMFSPPAIEFEAAKFKGDIYTICQLKSDKFDGTLKFQ